jgi:uncharacterized membrane protein
MSNKHQITQNNPAQLKQTEVKAVLYQGLIPHPDILKEFEKLHPGATKFFFSEIEKQTNHRISMENKAMDSNIRSEKRGSLFAFIITFSTIIGGFILTGFGFNVTGIITSIAGLATLVGIFITGKIISVKQIKNKS